MIKNKSSLEITVGERVYQFICENDSPLTEALEVLCKMKEYTQQLLDNAMKQAQEAQDKAAPEVVEVEECIHVDQSP